MDPSDISSDEFYSNLRRLAAKPIQDTMTTTIRDGIATTIGTPEEIVHTATITWPSLEEIYASQYRSAALRYATRAALSGYTPSSQFPTPSTEPLNPTRDIMALVDAAERELMSHVHTVGLLHHRQEQYWQSLSLPQKIFLRITQTSLWTWAKRFILSGFAFLFLALFLSAVLRSNYDNFRITYEVILQIFIEIGKLFVRIILRLILAVFETTAAILRALRIRERITAARDWVERTYLNIMYNAITDVLFEDAQRLSNFLGRNKHWMALGVLAWFWFSAWYQNRKRIEEGRFWSLEEMARVNGFRIPAAYHRQKAMWEGLYKDDCRCRC